MNLFFNDVSTRFKSEFVRRINKAKNILITTHISPDDDAISSVISTYHYLSKLYKTGDKKVKMATEGKRYTRWDCFEYYKKIKFTQNLSNELKAADLVIILDVSGWDRISNKYINNYKGKIICIDHHPDPGEVYDLHLVSENHTCTAEIIYELFFKDVKLNKEICEILLMGIYGDNVYFKYMLPKYADVLTLTKKLIIMGDVDIEKLLGKYDELTEKSFAVYKELIKNCEIGEVKGWPKFIYSYLSSNYITNNSFNEEDVIRGRTYFTDNHLKHIRGIIWGFILTAKGGGSTSISLRSRYNTVDVRDIVNKMKIGGGQKWASGGIIKKLSPEQAFKLIEQWLKDHKPKYFRV